MELAEVQALFWLGRSNDSRAKHWNGLVEDGLAPDDYEVDYLMGKAELDTNIERGLEKLKGVK